VYRRYFSVLFKSFSRIPLSQ